MNKKTNYYDELGDDFEGFMSDYDVDRRHVLIFDTLLAGSRFDGKRVLEIGSGTGRFSRSIQERGGELTVLDIGPNLVNDLATQLDCSGITGDTCFLPLRDQSYDLVISSECIEHTLDPEGAIREMCRVCRPGGIVCITTPNRLWYPTLIAAQRLGVRKYSGIENWIFPQRAATVMSEAGMSGIRLSGCHLWPFQLKFTRPLLQQMDRLGGTLYPLMINFGILGRK